MTKNTAMLAEFDPADYLDTPESIQAYINEAIATGDESFISESLDVAARAKESLILPIKRNVPNKCE